MARLEASHQEAFMRWVSFHPSISPLIWHTPNGGRRTMAEARAFKRMGVKAGIPDIQVAIPAKGYHGLFIEFKAKGGRVTENQKAMHQHLIDAGYNVEVVYDWFEARNILDEYIRGTKYDRKSATQELYHSPCLIGSKS